MFARRRLRISFLLAFLVLVFILYHVLPHQTFVHTSIDEAGAAIEAVGFNLSTMNIGELLAHEGEKLNLLIKAMLAKATLEKVGKKQARPVKQIWNKRRNEKIFEVVWLPILIFCKLDVL